jgi:hypothetical protein
MSGSAVGGPASSGTSSWFQRLLLPGFAFKAAVIGGGYATGRELAEYFIPSGPQGGVMAIAVAMVCWSVLCALTFALAQATRSFDYLSFFNTLLGPFAFVFEIAYVVFMVLILAVFGAAAGAIGQAMFGWPTLVGTLLLMAASARSPRSATVRSNACSSGCRSSCMACTCCSRVRAGRLRRPGRMDTSRRPCRPTAGCRAA